MSTQRMDLAIYATVAAAGLLAVWLFGLDGYPAIPETMRALGY